jgi:hypothetical protein
MGVTLDLFNILLSSLELIQDLTIEGRERIIITAKAD